MRNNVGEVSYIENGPNLGEKFDQILKLTIVWNLVIHSKSKQSNTLPLLVLTIIHYTYFLLIQNLIFFMHEQGDNGFITNNYFDQGSKCEIWFNGLNIIQICIIWIDQYRIRLFVSIDQISSPPWFAQVWNGQM